MRLSIERGFNVFAMHTRRSSRWSSRYYMPRFQTVYATIRPNPLRFTEVLAALGPRPVFDNAPCTKRRISSFGRARMFCSGRAGVSRVFHSEDRLVVLIPTRAIAYPRPSGRRPTRFSIFIWGRARKTPI